MTESAFTRDYYGQALVELGAEMPNLVVLDTDLSSSTRTSKFASAYPDRFFNCGIAEQNSMGIAAGLSKTGKVVFVSSFAMFATGRAWEQIRNSIVYPRFNIKIAATHAGITVGEDGASHQALEDIAIMRAIPYLNVLVPADAIETKQMVKAIAKADGSYYLRMSRGSTPVIFNDNEYNFTIGKSPVLRQGSDVSIMAAGIMVEMALQAAKHLEKENIKASVVNISSIKPIDVDTIVSVAKSTGAVVTAEEHSIYGGVGSAVAEVLIQNYPVPMEMVGIKGIFGESGKPTDLLKKYKLTTPEIITKIKKVLDRK